MTEKEEIKASKRGEKRGATGRVLQKRHGSTMTRMWQEHQEARRLHQEKRAVGVRDQAGTTVVSARDETHDRGAGAGRKRTAVAKAGFEAEEESRRRRGVCGPIALAQGFDMEEVAVLTSTACFSFI
ncbi:Hypothetical protein NocV09_01000720 [Nannochloropsis oceanica]